MIINSILSLALLWFCNKYLKHLKELGILKSKILSMEALPVVEAVKTIAALPKGKKVFLMIRGLIRIKNKIKGENSIYSLIQHSDIRATKLSDYLRRGSWNNLIDKSFWKMPFNLHKATFELQDMSEEVKLQIRGVKKSALTGALSQIFKSTDKKERSSNVIKRIVSNIYNFFASKYPFAMILKPTAIGEQITLHGIQDGQYVVVIGDFEKGVDGIPFCVFPKYVTKQVSYIESKLKKRYNKLCLITFLFVVLLTITVIKVIRQAIAKFNRWRSQRLANEEHQEQQRSQNQGQNCNCALCYTNIRTIIFKPCRHYAVCKACYQQVSAKGDCPFCKTSIQGIIEVIKKK